MAEHNVKVMNPDTEFGWLERTYLARDLARVVDHGGALCAQLYDLVARWPWRGHHLLPRRTVWSTAHAIAGVTRWHSAKTAHRSVLPALCAARRVQPTASTSWLKSTPTRTSKKRPVRFDIDYSRCVFCGFCEEACPCEAIYLTSDYTDLPSHDFRQLVVDKDFLLNMDQELVAKKRPVITGRR